MDRGSCLLYLLLLCVWCSLDTSLFIGVNGQSVSLNKVSIGVSTEGRSVEFICIAFGLQDGNIIEWLRDVNSEIIARNGISLNTKKYFLGETDFPMASRSEILIIFTLTKHDTGSYICRIKSSDEGGAMILTTSDNYYLSVLYFPAAIYPICFPDGPFTVQEGTILNMNCTTERGNPRVRIDVFAYSVALLAWTHTTDEGEPGASFQFEVSDVDTNSSYECRISSGSFSSMEGSCTIGPINVVPISMTTPSTETTFQPAQQTTVHAITDKPVTTDSNVMQTEDTSLSPMTNKPCCHLCKQTPCATMAVATASTVPYWIAISIVSLILIVSVLINIFLIIKHRHLKSLHEMEPNVPKADPYMELQPKDDKNIEYTGLDVHTYFQAVEPDRPNKSPQHDYELPEVKTNTEYETVEVSK